MSEDRPTSRGGRVKAIRKALGLKQPEFAERLNEAAAGLDLPTIYHNTKVSKMETGSRGVTVDDLYVLAAIDPRQRGVDWIALGVEVVNAPPPLHITRALDAQTKRRRRHG